MLKKIGILLSRFGKAFVKHSFRESNWCEDALAKVDSKLNRDIYYFNVAPSFIEELLEKDMDRVTPLGRCPCSSFSLWAFGPLYYQKMLA